jgi:hypothetical protein
MDYHAGGRSHLKACCNDYDNYLAIENLNDMSPAEAWHSERFRALRRRHLDDALDGTLCGKCIRRSAAAVRPINGELLSHPVAQDQHRAQADRLSLPPIDIR